MKITIRTSDRGYPKEELIRDIPTSWDQVTFRLFLQLDKCAQDIIKVIALFAGVDYDTLRTSKILDMDNVIAALGFLNTKMEPVVPKTILGYPVPKNLEFEQVQMYLDLNAYVKESKQLPPEIQLERYAVYCAVYSCIAKHGHYDWQLSEAMAPEFLEAPCTEVVGIGNFTLVKLIGLNYSINPGSQKAGSVIRRFRLGLRIFMINMASAFRWYFWKKRLD